MTAPGRGSGDGPVRLLVFSPSGGRGGAEAMLCRAVVSAVAAGWSVRCLVPAGPLADDLRAAGAAVRRAPVVALPDGPRALAALRLSAAVLRAARLLRVEERTADVLLVNGLLLLPALRLAPRRARRVWWAHDVVVRPDRLRLVRWAAPALDEVIAVSAAVRDRLTGLPVPVGIVRNGVDAAYPAVDPAAGGPPVGGPVVGCAAALTSWKGQHVLLDAVALLPAPVQVELAGAALPKDQPYEAQLRARAARPDLSGRARFLGHVADPAPVMRRWAVGVSASTDPEASGLAFLEGLALGVPQVVTAGGGPQEVVGNAGIVVPPGDAAALAAAVGRLLADEALWRRCSAAGPVVVRELAHRPTQEGLLLSALRGPVGATA